MMHHKKFLVLTIALELLLAPAAHVRAQSSTVTGASAGSLQDVTASGNPAITGSTVAGLPTATAGRQRRLTDGGASGAVVTADGTNFTCGEVKSQKYFNIACPPYNAIPNDAAQAGANVTAINNATIDASAQSGGRGVVFFPTGEWFVNARLQARDKVRYEGEGIGVSIVTSTVNNLAVFEYFNGSFSPTNTNIADVNFADMTISRNITAIAGGHGIVLMTDDVVTETGCAVGGTCNTGISSLKNVFIENQYNGIRWGVNNGGRWVSVTVQNSQSDGIFMKGANGQYLDVSVLKAKGSAWVVQPDDGETIDGGTWSNCTFWDSADGDLNSTPDDVNVDAFVWNIPNPLHCSVTIATSCAVNADCPGGETCVQNNVSGFIMNGVTIDGSGRDAMRITNASNAILNGMIVTGTNASATGVGVHVIRTNNALTNIAVVGGIITGSHEEGIKTNARVGGVITGVPFLSTATNITSIHVNNPTDGSGETGLMISGNFIVQAGTGTGILIEKTGTDIGARTVVTGEGAISIAGNGSNNTIVNWVNIAATFTGGYRLTGNMRTGDKESDDAGTSTIKAWDLADAAVIASDTCVEDQLIRLNVPGIGAKWMNICTVQ